MAGRGVRRVPPRSSRAARAESGPGDVSMRPLLLPATQPDHPQHAAPALADPASRTAPVDRPARPHDAPGSVTRPVLPERLDQGAATDLRVRALPRIPPPSLEGFEREYVVPRRPVVLRGLAADWPASRRWSP